MAKPVLVQWTTESQVVVNGSQYTQYRVSLSGDVDYTLMVPFGEVQARFETVDAGMYVATVELSNDDGSMVGTGLESAPFDVIDDAALDVPVTVTADAVSEPPA